MDDVVIMKNDFHAENVLETSCVRVTVAGKDGIVRVARVKVARADRTPEFSREVSSICSH